MNPLGCGGPRLSDSVGHTDLLGNDRCVGSVEAAVTLDNGTTSQFLNQDPEKGGRTAGIQAAFPWKRDASYRVST